METIVLEDSPLAAYLEGRDGADAEDVDAREDIHTSPKHSCLSHAPRGFPSFISRIPKPLTENVMNRSPIKKLRSAYASMVNSTLGSADNERFLEHFRYIIIASQLLNEHVGVASARVMAGSVIPPLPSSLALPAATVNVAGAFGVAAVSFLLVWMIDWARGGSSGIFSASRMALVSTVCLAVAVMLYAYARRQWLKYLRRLAIDTVSPFMENAQSFDATTCSVISLIQEVELVSRGYRLSTPLPPISRLEGNGQLRRCPRLRRGLRNCYANAIPAFARSGKILRELADEDNLERFLEVYDIKVEDVFEAEAGLTFSLDDDSDSLKHLRVHQFRLSTLRRLILCCLLAIPATGRQVDGPRWRTTVNEMEHLSGLVTDLRKKLDAILREEEESVHSPSNTTTKLKTGPTHTRVQSQVRRISTLSTGIRSIQAKLHLLRDESTRALSTSTSESELALHSTSLREQYEALGDDLKALMEAWEAGKTALTANIHRQERRLSRSSSLSGSIRSPMSSLGGLTVVDEDKDFNPGTPTHALGALDGTLQLALSPAHTDDGNDAGADEEVFEAVAAPKLRNPLSRDQRIAKMQEERVRMADMRAKREANTNMMKELQSVINMRPSRTAPGGRVISV